MSENKNVTEIHGCIVCAKLFNILVVYTSEGKFLDCTVTSPDGHIAIVTLQRKLSLLITEGSQRVAKNRTLNRKRIKTVLHGL